MSWIEFKPKPAAYVGLNVGTDYIQFTLAVRRMIRDNGWAHVKIEYDPETEQIRISPQEGGHRINKSGGIHATMAKVLKRGRYELVKQESTHLYFKRDLNVRA